MFLMSPMFLCYLKSLKNLKSLHYHWMPNYQMNYLRHLFLMFLLYLKWH